MNRRNFFNRLGLIVGAASCSPTLFIPKFEPVRWKVIRQMIWDFGSVVYTWEYVKGGVEWNRVEIDTATYSRIASAFYGKWRFEGLDATENVTPNTPLYPFPRQPFFEPRSECRL